MIFLLNREYILWEVVELARLHMCEVLKVPPSAITATLELNDSKISPEFQVDADQCPGVPAEDIREVMGSVYQDCKAELEVRLAGAQYSRQQYLETVVWNDKKETQEAPAGAS